MYEGFGLFDEGGGKEWWKERGEEGGILFCKLTKLLGAYILVQVVSKIKA